MISAAAFSACEGDEGSAGPAGPGGEAGPAGPATPGGVDPALAPAAKLIAAFGGAEALGGLQALAVESSGTRWIVGEGYVPEAEPMIASSFGLATLWDVQAGHVRLDYERTLLGFFTGDETYRELLRADGGYRVGVDSVFGGGDGPLPADRWASGRRQQRLLHPEIVAREIAADPSRAVDVGAGVLAGALHHRLEVADPVAPLTLWVDAATGRLAKISTLENEHVGGDVALEVFYSDCATQLPGKPVTHVVATHFHDDHSGGLRSFVAAGAKVVVGASAVGFYRAAVGAPRTVEPDALAAAPRAAVIEAVAPGATLELPDPARPVKVYTVDTKHAADMLVAGVAGTLFVSDLYNPGFPTGALPSLVELRASVQAQGIAVTTYAGGHGATSTPADLDRLIDDLTP